MRAALDEIADRELTASAATQWCRRNNEAPERVIVTESLAQKLLDAAKESRDLFPEK
ncbi:hypothetical protein GCM10009609_51220 [Pseudonocardia aurantiaca]|uniref:Uncharacterized protein n=1 Tax=Pseudonocardia aurantiaca TaxID=75290 RepID=A0ABW4FSW2_9PSEU